jgi:hypothetical protein
MVVTEKVEFCTLGKSCHLVIDGAIFEVEDQVRHDPATTDGLRQVAGGYRFSLRRAQD